MGMHKCGIVFIEENNKKMLAILPRFTLAARPGAPPPRGLSVSANTVIAKYAPLQKHPSLFDPTRVEDESGYTQNTRRFSTPL